MIKTYFLMPLSKSYPTKTFSYDGKEWQKVKDYPLMKYFKGIIQSVSDLKDFYEALKIISTKKVFMIHGKFIEGTDTKKMIRRSRNDHSDGIPATIENCALKIFAIDVDDFPITGVSDNIIGRGKESIETFIETKLPKEFQKADYIYQFSSSFGLTSNKLKVHLFFQLKEEVLNSDLMKWAQAWNKANGENLIDPSIYRSVQPIYTSNRIIEGDKPDPIEDKDKIGYVSKNSKYLNWVPSVIEDISDSKDSDPRQVNLNDSSISDFDISSSIRKILTAENFHEQIRSTALSLINKKVPVKDTIVFIQEFMRVARTGLTGQRLKDWETRFEDIPRAVESAASIVDLPTYEDMLAWLSTANKQVIRNEFPRKLIPFDGVDLKGLVRELDAILGYGPRAIMEDIKAAKEEHKQQLKEIAQKLRSEERKKKDIFEIEITNSTYGSVTTSICKILAKSKKKPEVYKLGNTLSIIEHSIPKTIRQIIRKEDLKDDYPKMPVVQSIDSPVGIIRNRVEKDCVFINESGKEIICPDSILNAIPKMYGIDWNPLSGIVEHPFIDNNWRLVEKSGYDAATGLYTELHRKLKIKLIDSDKAYKYLTEEVLAEFPFQTELDQATAIGMFMTAIQRPYVTGDNGMPGYAIVSPKPSSGKTTLAQLLSYAIYNRPAAATGWSDNDEELGKHLLAILREGHSCVLFDNIKKDAAIQSNELAKAMTSGTYSRRKLGVNETEEVPSSVLWLFTGNNIVFKGDFATRILPIRIVPKTERPEFRKFLRQDIGQWAIDNRKKIISAILSLIMVGKEINSDDYEGSARFKEWNRFVRLPLMKISGQDLLDVFDRNDFLDDETIAKGELLELLNNTFGSRTFLTKDIMKLIDGVQVEGTNVSVDVNGNDFKHAITEAFNEKATTNIKTLGRYILGMKDFILRGYMLTRESGKPMAKWKIIQVEEDENVKQN